jgi:hypothetical protein
MSESGCLHNNKYESVEVKNHIESNEYTVTDEFSITNYTLGENQIITAVMYSSGNGAGKFNVMSHRISSSSIDSNKTAEGRDTVANRDSLNAYNNYFVKVLHDEKTNDKIDFTHPTSGDGASLYQGYVEWPADSILYDLTIIPSKDVFGVGPTTYNENLDAQTAERSDAELIVNLLSVKTDQSNLVDINENVISNSLRVDNFGPMHMGVYPTFDKNSYLIRDFPILAAPDAGHPRKIRRWFKHMPICVVREGGLPCEIVKLEGVVYHQHGTSTTASDTNHVVFEHGSKDQNTLTVPSGKGDDTSEINRSNTSPAGEPWTNFSFNNIQRREGTAARSDKKELIQGYANFPTGNPREKSYSSMGQFYNHKENVGLMLNIGFNGVGVTPPIPNGSLFTNNGSEAEGGISSNERTSDAGAMSDIQFKAIFTFKKI